MCSSPCGCCEPVVSFDKNFDEAVPWKCFFQDTPHLLDLDTSYLDAIYGESTKNSRWILASLQDIRNPGARPILKSCVAGFYTPERYTDPYNLPGVYLWPRSIVARMKFTQPDPNVWQSQKLTILWKYRMHTDDTTGDSVMYLVLSDENDDPSQSNLSGLLSYPRMVFYFIRNNGLSDTGYMDGQLTADEGAPISTANNGRFTARTPPNVSAAISFPLTGTFEIQIECRPYETVFRVKMNSVQLELTKLGTATWSDSCTLPYRMFRESPRYRVTFYGDQHLIHSSIQRVVAVDYDRIAVKSELLSP